MHARNGQNGLTVTKPPLPPWMQDLRDAISTSVSSDDIKEMVQAQVTKAKKGDAKACQFVLNLLNATTPAAPAAAPQPPPAHEANGHEPPEPELLPPPAARTTPQLRHRVYALLEKRGPLDPGQIAASLGADRDDVRTALVDAGMFTKVKGGQFDVAVKV